MNRTIGGDRLGAGKKQKVHLHNYERSTHDLSYVWRSTMAAGTLVPFMNEVALPGDTFDINLDVDVKTHPTIGPLFGSFKVQIDVFMCPIRLYNKLLHNNKLGIGMKMEQVVLPELRVWGEYSKAAKDPDNQQINPSSILSYLGIRGLGRSVNEKARFNRTFNGVPYIAYWDVYKNYYANKQEEVGYVIHSELVPPPVMGVLVQGRVGGTAVTIPEEGDAAEPEITVPRGSILIIMQNVGIDQSPYLDGTLIRTTDGWKRPSELMTDWTFMDNEGGGGDVWTGTGKIGNWNVYSYRLATVEEMYEGEPQLKEFPLENIDRMREDILTTQGNQTFRIDEATYAPYGLGLQWVNNGVDDAYNILASQEGLAIKTYQSDLFNNWMSTEWIDGDNGINAITAIDTSEGSFTLDTLNLSKKVYNMLNRIAISGGSYDDWLDAVYTHERYRRAESPMYMGGLSRELVFQEVVSNAEAGSEQPLGTLAGKGVMGSRKKGGNVTVKVDEPSYIMGIISLTPRIDYSQGNKWDTNLRTMDDFHKPALDEIGFQDLITDQMAWWDTLIPEVGEIVFQSAGKQPAWTNYMTNVNQVRGNFAIRDNEMFMTLNRRYEQGLDGRIADLTTYIDPVKFNHIFAQTSRDAQNFWTQIGVDITARRKMSAKVMPNL